MNEPINAKDPPWPLVRRVSRASLCCRPSQVFLQFEVFFLIFWVIVDSDCLAQLTGVLGPYIKICYGKFIKLVS